MISLQNILLAESIHSKLLCNTEECLSYILVLLNLLTIFYLVYSSYRKVTKITQIFGYFWSCFIMCGTVTVLFIHTCIFTIMCAVFTGMAIIAVLSMIYESKHPENRTQNDEFDNNYKLENKPQGCYVIYKTDDDKFTFALHAKNKKKLLQSVYKYDTLEEAKKAIFKCRDFGSMAELENSTGEWILDVNHPKFRLYLNGETYYIDLAVSENTILLKSNPVESYSEANWNANNSMKCVNTTVLYFAKGKNNVLDGKDFLYEKSESNDAQ